MKQNMLCGVITALATPMHLDGRIDFDSLTNLVEFQIRNKVDGMVVTGSTGEGSMLDFDEKIAVLQHVIKVTKKRSRIIMAFNDIATNFALDFIKRLNLINDIDYYLATTPAYVRPTQEGLYLHFKAIATTSSRPIILYNVPGRTACDLENDTVLRLANDYSNIVGIKDATGNLSRLSDLFKRKNPDFALYSGDDGTFLEFVLSGGNGVISVASNLIPDKFKDIMANVAAGDKLSATGLDNKFHGLYEALSLESNPVALKWALFFQGIIKHSMVRLPLVALSKHSQEKMKLVLMDIR